MPDKTQYSAAQFLVDTLLEQCPYEIDDIYSDSGKEYNGNPSHAFVQAYCQPQTNGKAEWIIRTIMQMWHE